MHNRTEKNNTTKRVAVLVILAARRIGRCSSNAGGENKRPLLCGVVYARQRP